MKTTILILALSTLSVLSQTVGLEWDANNDNTSGYRIYGAANGVTNLLTTTSGIGTTANVNVACPSDWTFFVSATYPTGVESGKSSPLPVAMRLNQAPAILQFDTIPVAGNAFNLIVRCSVPAKPFYVTNFVFSLLRNTGVTELQVRGTNNICTFLNLTPGSYTCSVRGDNWCGAGVAASRPFQLTGQGIIPKNLRVR